MGGPGSGGRPKPTALKILTGETRPSRLNKAAPKPAGGGPRMPAGMRERSKAVWVRQVAAMRLTGVLTVVDADMLRGYCDAVARYEEAERDLKKRGLVVAGARPDTIVRNPAHMIAIQEMALIDRLAMHLGFAQGAREGIHVTDPEPKEDPFGAWEAGG
jgi:P27 family predicted phage terminase small subunit